MGAKRSQANRHSGETVVKASNSVDSRGRYHAAGFELTNQSVIGRDWTATGARKPKRKGMALICGISILTVSCERFLTSHSGGRANARWLIFTLENTT